MKVLCQMHGPSSTAAGASKNKRTPLVYHSTTFENEFKKEAKLLSKFSHPHIVKMVEARVDDESMAAI
jgi:serine/threonine protein kinase